MNNPFHRLKEIKFLRGEIKNKLEYGLGTLQGERGGRGVNDNSPYKKMVSVGVLFNLISLITAFRVMRRPDTRFQLFQY